MNSLLTVKIKCLKRLLNSNREVEMKANCRNFELKIPKINKPTIIVKGTISSFLLLQSVSIF